MTQKIDYQQLAAEFLEKSIIKYIPKSAKKQYLATDFLDLQSRFNISIEVELETDNGLYGSREDTWDYDYYREAAIENLCSDRYSLEQQFQDLKLGDIDVFDDIIDTLTYPTTSSDEEKSNF
jgi:hypothetical protein